MSIADTRPRRDALKAGLAVFAGCMFARPARSLAADGDAPGPDGHRCGDCVNFDAPDHCRLIDGKVSPGGHCLSFAPKGM